MEKLVSAKTETSPVLYKNFFRTYYAEKMKTAKIVMFIIAILLILAAMKLYYSGSALMYPIILVWLGLFLIVYPFNMYRKPYRKMRDIKITSHFDFYDDYMTEHSGGKTETHKYGDILRTLETGQYFYIFYTAENASLVEKSNITMGNEDILRSLLKSKTNYKKKK